MLNKIKQQLKVFFSNSKRVFELEEEIESLKNERENLIARLFDAENTPTAEMVVKKVLGRGIGWYDYNEINDQSRKKTYFNDIQQVLKNESFTNELNYLLADMVQHVAKASKSHDETLQVRMIINAIEMIKERLEGISSPDSHVPTTNDIHDAT